jgi:hypothetical protein
MLIGKRGVSLRASVPNKEVQMKRNRWIFSPLTLALVAGCAPQAHPDPEPAPAEAFDYAPPSSAAPNSANVTLMIVSPAYSSSQAWNGAYPFNVFAQHLRDDFQEALTARGYTVRGPFASYQEATFPDKQSSDRAVEPELGVTLHISDVTAREKLNLLGPNTLSFSGFLTVGGAVKLSVHESLSNENMWVKNIEIRRQPVAWRGTRAYPKGTVDPDFLSDPGFRNALTTELNSVYQQIMKAVWDYMDPQEMALVKSQSLEVRKRWVSTSHR